MEGVEEMDSVLVRALRCISGISHTHWSTNPPFTGLFTKAHISFVSNSHQCQTHCWDFVSAWFYPIMSVDHESQKMPPEKALNVITVENGDEVCLKFFTRVVMQQNLRPKTAPWRKVRYTENCTMEKSAIHWRKPHPREKCDTLSCCNHRRKNLSHSGKSVSSEFI